jgi:hypothetical protein
VQDWDFRHPRAVGLSFYTNIFLTLGYLVKFDNLRCLGRDALCIGQFSLAGGLMCNDWISNELKSINLSDKRLNRRLGEILGSLGERPHQNIPTACGGHAETMAAYRFFDNDKVTFEKVLTTLPIASCIPEENCRNNPPL